MGRPSLDLGHEADGETWVDILPRGPEPREPRLAPLRRCGRLWALTNSLLPLKFPRPSGAWDSRSDVQSRCSQAGDLHRIRTSSAGGGDVLADLAVKLDWRLLLPQLPPPQLRNPSDPFDPSVRDVGHFASEPSQGHSFRDRGGTKQDGQSGLFSLQPAFPRLSFCRSGFNHFRLHSSDPTAPLLSPRSERVRDGWRPGLVIWPRPNSNTVGVARADGAGGVLAEAVAREGRSRRARWADRPVPPTPQARSHITALR